MRNLSTGVASNITVAEMVFRLRKQANMTQSELAKASGLSSPFVSMVEKGIRMPRPHNLIKLLATLAAAIK